MSPLVSSPVYSSDIIAIAEFDISENVLITFLIALTSQLDAVDTRKMYVLQPMRI